MQWYILIGAGALGGLLGGLGMGGGTLLIPILTMLVGYEQIQAQAINLISFVPMALCSLVILVKNKLISVKALLLVTPLAAVGCVVGALLSATLPPKLLSKAFGAFILIIGAIFLFKVILQIIADIFNTHKPKKTKKVSEIDKFSSFN